MRSCGTPDTNVTTSCRPSRSSTAGILLLSFCLPMTTRCTSSRSTRSFATASSSGTRPFIGTSALAVVMMRPGTRCTCGIGRKLSWSTPTGTMCSRSAGTPICATMSRREFSLTVTSRGICFATFICISRNAYQRRSVARFHGDVACSMSRSRSTVIGWCSVATTGQPSSIIPSRPGAEALVVVDEVEVVAPVGEEVPGPEAERVRLGEARRAHDRELLQVDPVPELPRPRHPERVAGR